LANIFLHILPEAVEQSDNLTILFALVIGGFLFSFILEKFVHWHHCHNLNCSHVKPVGIMMLIGDGLHNFIDGILIAASFLVSPSVGIATTVAVLLHEIPQEISDFAVLIYSGFSKKNALIFNFISALTAFIGAALVLLISEHMNGIEYILLPIAAGNFLYIAASDLVPELHKESHFKNAILQIVAMFAGIVLLYTLTLGGHSHNHSYEEGTHIEHGHDHHDH